MLHQIIFWALFWIAVGAGLGWLVASTVGAIAGGLLVVGGMALLVCWANKFVVIG